jgi:hypothetical protein
VEVAAGFGLVIFGAVFGNAEILMTICVSFGLADGDAEGEADPEAVGDGVSVGVGVGDGVGDGVAVPLDFDDNDGDGVGDADGEARSPMTLKRSVHEKPWSCGHLYPLGASANAYVTCDPGGALDVVVGLGCGDCDATGLACAFGFTGGFTPVAPPPFPKLPWHAASASANAASAARADEVMFLR